MFCAFGSWYFDHLIRFQWNQFRCPLRCCKEVSFGTGWTRALRPKRTAKESGPLVVTSVPAAPLRIWISASMASCSRIGEPVPTSLRPRRSCSRWRSKPIWNKERSPFRTVACQQHMWPQIRRLQLAAEHLQISWRWCGDVLLQPIAGFPLSRSFQIPPNHQFYITLWGCSIPNHPAILVPPCSETSKCGSFGQKCPRLWFPHAWSFGLRLADQRQRHDCRDGQAWRRKGHSLERWNWRHRSFQIMSTLDPLLTALSSCSFNSLNFCTFVSSFELACSSLLDQQVSTHRLIVRKQFKCLQSHQVLCKPLGSMAIYRLSLWLISNQTSDDSAHLYSDTSTSGLSLCTKVPKVECHLLISASMRLLFATGQTRNESF